MRCLLVGSGGRESALAWKLSCSPLLERLFLYPGSPAARRWGETVSVKEVDVHAQAVTLTNPEHLKQLVSWAKKERIDLVFCGPEAPLCAGLADLMHQEGIAVWGARREVARLEGSKVFAKDLMRSAGIPQADYEVTSGARETEQCALKLLATEGGAVIKADGLAGGKGVFVCTTDQEVHEAAERLFGSLPAACSTTLVESVLTGEECSYFAWVHQDHVKFLGFARDYKRLLSGDRGVNTGGMGCYTPLPWLPQDAHQMVEQRVIHPLLRALKSKGLSYTGFLYAGLMWGNKGPQVLEFNIRLGDPECQALAVADERDWLAVVQGILAEPPEGSKVGVQETSLPLNPTACAVLASPCYPWKEGPHHPTKIPDEVWQPSDQRHIFGGALKRSEGITMTHRGRVLSVVCRGSSLIQAREQLYRQVEIIRQELWSDFQMRDDIALL